MLSDSDAGALQLLDQSLAGIVGAAGRIERVIVPTPDHLDVLRLGFGP